MNPDEPPTLLEEECAALLAVCDDLLAQGDEPVVPDDSNLSSEVKGRLLRGLDCLRRLEQIWPRGSSHSLERAGSASEGNAPVANASGTFGTSDVPGYEILGELGRGGMGVVYKARQVGLNRLVALKMIPAGVVASPQTRARFHAEALASGRLQHPHIVQIHDTGEYRGQPYFSLELVEGGTLAQKLAGRPQPAGEAARLIETLARAVHHAHQHGIIHRDLKPGNILLASGGCEPPDGKEPEGPHLPLANCVPKISDFGLAKSLEEDSNQTRTGTIVGTPSYMAPEQALGAKESTVGPAADIYALGVILYEMLTGRPPFCGQTPLETLDLVRTQEPVSPRRLQPATPRDLETICLQCLAKEPRRRYASALELADDLARFLAGKPVRARRTGMGERTVKWVKRRPAVAALAATVLLALVGGIVATTWQAQRAMSEADRNRRLLYSADVHLASHAWQSDEGTVSQCIELLMAHVPGLGQPDLREFCWRYQWRLLHPDSVVRLPVVPVAAGVATGDRVVTFDGQGKMNAWLIGDRGPRDEWTLAGNGVKGVTLSRNGEVAAVIDRDGSPKVFEVRTGVQKVQVHAPSALVNLKLSADGRFLVGVGSDKHARVWDTATGREFYDYLMIDPTAREIDLSLDGKQLLASWTAEGELVALYHAGEEKPTVLNPQMNGFNRLQGALSPDGKLAAVAVAGNFIEFYDTTTGKLLTGLPSQSAPIRVTFSPDGNQLAVGEITGLVTLWRLPRPLLSADQPVAAGEPRQTAAGQPRPRHLKGHQGRIEALAFTADGRKLISICHDNTARCWDVGDQEESRVLQKKAPFQIDALSYSPDGRYLVEASMSDGIHVHDLTSTGRPRSLTNRASRRAVFSPDGRMIAGGPDHRVTLWDAKTGNLLATLVGADPAEQDPVNGFSNLGALVFSPDGRWLAAGFGALYSFSADAPQKVMVFDVAQRKQHRTFATPTQVSAIAFSADGKLLAAAGHNGAVWLWDTSSWDEIGRWQGPTGMKYGSILFLSGGQLATGSTSGRIDLWDVRTRALTRQLHGHIALVSFMAVSGDGRTLATASCDRSIKLWDTGTGRELRTLCREEGWMFTVAFSPDGNTLASGGLSPALRLWEASPKETVAADLAGW
jgi:eukaryotic-like serine/threonine-protein kinase